ncbi:MAG TPA: M20/M25/M40 family metallo-hydrolase [Pyrinomonadaceae bacterium]|nr:M20/M25/M40 family metallo-hydrolase [Pyrinomonadaceae bacterium]
MRTKALLTLAALLSFFLTQNSQAQNGPSLYTQLRSWIALDAPPGWEHRATDTIMRQMPGWKRDALGNLILRKGSGSPRRVVACALDRPSFAVTEITDDGYVRLREVGAARSHPLWTQFHEGQRVRVLTRGGAVPAVAIVKSTHLQGGRNPNTPPATLNDMWVDVGAASRAEVKRLGIEMLDPVVRESEGWAYENFVAGQLAGVRVGCAAVAAAASREVTSGETIFLLTTLRSFGHDGLEAALRSLGRVDQVTLLDQSTDATTGVSQRKVEKPSYLPESTGLTASTILSPRVRYAGSLVESVSVDDAVALLTEVQKAAGVATSPGGWTMLSQPAPESARQDAFSPTANLLKSLADVYSVSGHEHKAREAVLAALPAWARARAKTDAEGNLIVEAGPDRDPVMFIAHLDEVGFDVTNVAADGTVSLRTRGGLFQSLWEGQPALLHFDPPSTKAPLQGVFVPRDTATAKQPEALTAWFGVDGEALKKLGVVSGMAVTAAKEATRLGPTRFTARGLDDRAGSTALVLAAQRIDPSSLKRKVILSWSVREETGLEGAMAMARQYGASVKRVFSVDTFVSSDSPVETTRFAHAPLGEGAVIRGLDNASVAPPAEIDRVLGIARTQNIPMQVGATNGGTDGSDFIRYGALHVGLSWPGRYSHSPVEVLDLRDLQSLVRLVHALANAP